MIAQRQSFVKVTSLGLIIIALVYLIFVNTVMQNNPDPAPSIYPTGGTDGPNNLQPFPL